MTMCLSICYFVSEGISYRLIRSAVSRKMYRGDMERQALLQNITCSL